MNNRIVTSLCVLCALLSAIQRASAQGQLSPTAAPAPTMKSLDQVEPRTPISSVPYTISSPGSYYLTTNLTGVSGQYGISIQANNITLDLNGFALIGVPGAFDGITNPGFQTNLVVRNGIVTRWGGYGVYAFNVYNGLFERLVISDNNYAGLAPGRRARVQDCVASSNAQDGFFVADECVVMNCTADKNSQAGIEVVGTGCRIENNHLLNNGCGLKVDTTRHLIIQNSASGNTTNYLFTGTQVTGPTNNLVAADGTITNANPWANFSF